MVSSTVVPPATSARTASQTSRRPAGSSPVVGSSRKSTSGRQHQPGGEVEPAPHAAGELPHRLAPGVGQPDLVEQLVGPAPGRPAVEVVQPGEQHQVLPALEDLVDGGLLTDQPDPAADLPRLADDVDPGDLDPPASGRSSVVMTRTAVVLPAPFGPSRAHTAPAPPAGRPRRAPPSRRTS